MTSVVIAMLSGALIALGAAAIWRDLGRNRRPAARTNALATRAPAVAIAPAARHAQGAQSPAGRVPTAVLDTAPRQLSPPPLSSAMAPVPYASGASVPAVPATVLQDLGALIGGIVSEADDTGPEFERSPAVEAGWHALGPRLDAAAARVNGVVGQVGLLIGAAGEPGWSYKNRGYGVYRRIRLNDPSIAWLRIELTGHRHVAFRLRAHRQEQALMNANTELPIDDLGEAALTDALARCVKPAAQYAAWSAPKTEVERDHSTALWSEIAETATAAVQMTNNAFRQVGAVLVPLGQPGYEPSIQRHRWPLSINVDGIPVALLLVERQPDVLAISVGVADAARRDLGQRRQIPVLGLTPHFLAENIASAAWPPIAEARQAAGAA